MVIQTQILSNRANQISYLVSHIVVSLSVMKARVSEPPLMVHE